MPSGVMPFLSVKVALTKNDLPSVQESLGACHEDAENEYFSYLRPFYFHSFISFICVLIFFIFFVSRLASFGPCIFYAVNKAACAGTTSVL